MPAKSKAVNFTDAKIKRAIAAKESGVNDRNFAERFGVSWSSIKKEAKERKMMVDVK